MKGYIIGVRLGTEGVGRDKVICQGARENKRQRGGARQKSKKKVPTKKSGGER